jgi:hypothetical protein
MKCTWKRVIFQQTVQGLVRAVRAVYNAWLFLMGSRVVADSTSHMHAATDEEEENAHSWRLRREDRTAKCSAPDVENIGHSRRLRSKGQAAQRSAAVRM